MEQTGIKDWSKKEQEAYFESLFNKWYASLCNTVYRIVRNQDAAEDIVQDVFVKLWEKRDELQLLTIKSYLFRASINTALNYTGKSKLRPLATEESLALAPSDRVNADEHLEAEELDKKIITIIDNLPPACKNVFVLSRTEQLSYKEIAITLNISVKTVENQMGKALKLLREQLGDYLALVLWMIYYYTN